MSEIPERLREALASRYELDRVVGHGGMATVYLARDARHNRQVAVKVLRQEVAASVGAERFLREIGIAAQLQHPHVLTLIDSGEADGVLYYVMPFLAGESLRGRLVRTGTIPLVEAVRIAREVADALDHAHRRGVVHRDIKPENILFLEGHAIVTDFGIAKALSAATGGHLTRTGFPLGTPGYMSPEQAAATLQLDERTDVFSLAVVVYEMLIGETPGLWPGDEALRMQRMVDADERHRAVLDRLPAGIEHALVRAMAMRPARRFGTPGDFVSALEAALGDRPRYSAEQVQAIVGRAAQLEAEQPTRGGSMTLGGIERLASEVGIPPEHVREAAHHVERPTPEPPTTNPLLGSPTVIALERVVDGEVPESEYVTLVEEMRMATRTLGQASTLGRSLAWHTAPTSSSPRDVHVTVTPRGGETRIRVEEKLGALVGGLFGGIVGGWGGGGTGVAMGVGMGALNSPALAVMLVILNLGGSYTLARTLLRNNYRKRRRELTNLIDRLADHCAETAPRSGLLARGNPGSPA